MRSALLAGMAMIVAAACEARAAGLELRDGDRIVFVGGTLIEREQKYGYWETWLASRHPDLNLTFRNLGWSGDTVWGEARAEFGTAEDGFKALVEQVKACQPTLIVLAYGANESFAGEAGLEPFGQGLDRLLDELSATGARLAFILPPPIWSELLPPSERWARLDNASLYSKSLRAKAHDRGAVVLDLCSNIVHGLLNSKQTGLDSAYEPNGQLSESGYKLSAAMLTELNPWAGVTLDTAFESELSRLEPLRRAIVAKNDLYFHRWRPQNTTYLFGFRKHEQGNNAAEIPEFDTLVAEQEHRIADLLRPTTQR